MYTIKISQESLDAFRKEKSLVPAPLNQKDILADALFEEIFDDGYYTANERVKPYTALGFIQDIPCLLEWAFDSHHITITPLRIQSNKSKTSEVIILRLTQYNGEHDAQTICDATESTNMDEPYKIVASYYYKPEDDHLAKREYVSN